MVQPQDENTRSSSTRWAWKRVRIPPSPEAPSSAVAKRPPPLGTWDPRTPLTVTITYRGGPEAWYELKARGRRWRRPGSLSLHDVMMELYQPARARPDS